MASTSATRAANSAASTRNMPGYSWKYMPLASALGYSVISIAITLINKAVLTSYSAYENNDTKVFQLTFFYELTLSPQPTSLIRLRVINDTHLVTRTLHSDLLRGHATIGLY